MSLKSFETKWKKSLTSILEELTEPEYKKVLFNLDKIPQGLKADKVRVEMSELIIQHYGAESSITKINVVMKELPRMDAAVQDKLRPQVDKLKQLRQKKRELRKSEADPAPVPKKEPEAKPAPAPKKEPEAKPVPAPKKEPSAKSAPAPKKEPAAKLVPAPKKEPAAKSAPAPKKQPAAKSAPAPKKKPAAVKQ